MDTKHVKLTVVCSVVLLIQLQAVSVFAACPADCAANGGTCDGIISCLCASGTGGAACADDCDSTCTACTGTAVGECLTCPTCSGYGQFCQTVDDDTTRTSACACKTGFTGVLCDECSNDATGCSAGGTCDTGVCACDATHAGTFCQLTCTCTSLQTCAADIGETAAVCSCITGLSGPLCETMTCATTDPCTNGGTCNTNTCDCPANYAGTICQHDCSPACAAGKECTENADKTGAVCTDGASSLLVTWTILILGVWSATKLY